MMSSMKALIRAFTTHPASVGETYLQHMATAFRFAAVMLCLALASCVHGMFPFLFTKIGSRTITHLYEKMTIGRMRASSGMKPDNSP